LQNFYITDNQKEKILHTSQMTSLYPQKHHLVQTVSQTKLSYCYHLNYLAKLHPLTFDIQHPFRVICSSCHINLNTELTSQERIFPLERMKNNAVKYVIFSKGCMKIASIMKNKKMKTIWEDPLIEGLLEVFEHSKNSEDMHGDLVWALKHLAFDEEIFKFAVNSPYYQQQFLPKRNIAMIDVRYVIERLLGIHHIYHKIVNPGKLTYRLCFVNLDRV